MGMSDSSNDAGRGGGSSGTGVGGTGGGRGGGSSSSAGKGAAGGGGSSSKGNGGFGPASTHTNFGGSSVSRGTAEVGAVQGDRSIGGRNGATGGVYGNAETGGVSSYGGRFGRELGTRAGDTASSNQSLTSGSVVSMDDMAEQAERSFMDRVASNMTPAEHTASMVAAGVPQTVQENARPGVLGTVTSLAAGLIGGPMAGVVSNGINTTLSAKRASDTLADINDQFGTSLDASLSNSMKQQTVGAATGFLGGKAGSTMGATAGFSVAGVPGAIAGGLLGGAAGQSFGRSAAFSGGESAPGAGMGNAPSQGLLASAAPTTPTTATQPSLSGPADFDGYASYAESFFG